MIIYLRNSKKMEKEDGVKTKISYISLLKKKLKFKMF